MKRQPSLQLTDRDLLGILQLIIKKTIWYKMNYKIAPWPFSHIIKRELSLLRTAGIDDDAFIDRGFESAAEIKLGTFARNYGDILSGEQI